MSPKKFFEEILGVSKKTPYSWGAFDPKKRRVFLQVWADQTRTSADGNSGEVEVFWDHARLDSHKNTYEERRSHIELLEHGVRGYGVVCRAVDPDSVGVREIDTFDEIELLRLGDLTKKGTTLYAKITGRFPVSELHHLSEPTSGLAADLEGILQNDELDPTTKECLVDARIGQGIFRAGVLNIWDHRCCVTGSRMRQAIRASHIKPWRVSSNIERLDPMNGLPLVASLDALFDAGLISFDPNGSMRVSSALSASERRIFDLEGKALSAAVSERTADFLTYHRDQIFKP